MKAAKLPASHVWVKGCVAYYLAAQSVKGEAPKKAAAKKASTPRKRSGKASGPRTSDGKRHKVISRQAPPVAT